MERRTKVILLCAIAVMIAMVLFPPQFVEFHGAVSSMSKHEYHFIGDRRWMFPNARPDFEVPELLQPKIDYGRLALQCLVLALLTGGVLVVLAKGRKERDLALDVEDARKDAAERSQRAAGIK